MVFVVTAWNTFSVPVFKCRYTDYDKAIAAYKRWNTPDNVTTFNIF